jgi:hypothetical protein
MAQEKNADGSNAPIEFIPMPGGKDCEEFYGGSRWGKPTTRYEYIWYGNVDEDKYPEDACPPYYHRYGQIDFFQVNTSLTGDGLVNILGSITAAGNITSGSQICGASICSVNKLFDIPHPIKENKRLVHACLEGPENGVYIRGRLTGENIIELPDYWKGLVDLESITVSLTQIGSSQDLIVDRIEWGARVVVRSGTASTIDCYYTVNATRKDIAPLEVEQDVVEGRVYPEG